MLEVAPADRAVDCQIVIEKIAFRMTLPLGHLTLAISDQWRRIRREMKGFCRSHSTCSGAAGRRTNGQLGVKRRSTFGLTIGA